MEHNAFGYHCSKQYVNPESSKLSENIKGLELEISDSRRVVQNNLDKLIDDYIITAPYNVDEIEKTKVCIENDGSVYKELVFKADKQRNVLRTLKELNNGGLNPNIVRNHSGTSAHIHLNRRYLDCLEIYEEDIVKASEFFMNVAFKTSGRNYDSMSEWCRSTLPCDINADLLTRAKSVDRINEMSYNRYNAVNLNPSNTIELRIFSNYCNFDYNTIKYYLEFSDMIINVAEEMVGKSYVNDGEIAIEMMNDYFNKYERRKKIYKKYQLKNMLCDYNKLRELNKIRIWTEIESRIDSFSRQIEYRNKTHNIMEFIRLIRHIDEIQGIPMNITINMKEPNFEYMINEIKNQTKIKLNL